jgi:hypothetical protein
MSGWLFELSVPGMALVIFLSTYLAAAAVYLVVMRLAVNDRVRAFKALSPGMLPPLGILFALLVGFMAAQVWSDFERAKLAVATEASALRAAMLLATSFPGDAETRLRALINRHIEQAVNQEWAQMAQQQETLRDLPMTLVEALKSTFALAPDTEGQKLAQREIVTALEKALDARRQRIILSQSTITPIKWSALLLQALCALIAIAMVHSDNRLTCGIALTMFATGIALSVLLMATYCRPFSGAVSVGPELLQQVIAREASDATGH